MSHNLDVGLYVHMELASPWEYWSKLLEHSNRPTVSFLRLSPVFPAVSGAAFVLHLRGFRVQPRAAGHSSGGSVLAGTARSLDGQAQRLRVRAAQRVRACQERQRLGPGPGARTAQERSVHLRPESVFPAFLPQGERADQREKSCASV